MKLTSLFLVWLPKKCFIKKQKKNLDFFQTFSPKEKYCTFLKLSDLPSTKNSVYFLRRYLLIFFSLNWLLVNCYLVGNMHSQILDMGASQTLEKEGKILIIRRYALYEKRGRNFDCKTLSILRRKSRSQKTIKRSSLEAEKKHFFIG